MLIRKRMSRPFLQLHIFFLFCGFKIFESVGIKSTYNIVKKQHRAPSVFKTLYTGHFNGKLRCFNFCSHSVECVSFNYKASENLCELVNAPYDVLLPDTDFIHVIMKVPGAVFCDDDPPTRDNTHRSLDRMTGWTYTCTSGYTAISGNKQVTCQGNVWTIPLQCTAISTCKLIKQCNSGYGDGDYVLLPDAYANKSPVKVYCHGMSGVTPEEFISLQVENNYAVSNWSIGIGTDPCTFEHRDGTKIGRFTKIGINVNTMVVKTKDLTFATIQEYGSRSQAIAEQDLRGTLHVANIEYGAASDCASRNSCPAGEFRVDLTKTGLKVDPSVQWKSSGYEMYMDITHSNDDTVVIGHCGGWPGYCYCYDGTFRLVPSGVQEPAITPVCVT